VAANDVVAGGTTGPFGDPPGGQRMPPVTFWRSLLCVSSGAHPHLTHCHKHVYMDAISHHPFLLDPVPTQASRGPRSRTRRAPHVQYPAGQQRSVAQLAQCIRAVMPRASARSRPRNSAIAKP
jgi:hypothetical protein